MSTTYYICRKYEYERTKAITDYIGRIQRTLHSYLDASLPVELKDDLQLTDDLEDAISPMCSKLEEHIGYDPQVRLCTITRERIIWHREELGEGRPETTRCHDCNALFGHLHHWGCDAERCPACGGQLISCDCEDVFIDG